MFELAALSLYTQLTEMVAVVVVSGGGDLTNRKACNAKQTGKAACPEAATHCQQRDETVDVATWLDPPCSRAAHP